MADKDTVEKNAETAVDLPAGKAGVPSTDGEEKKVEGEVPTEAEVSTEVPSTDGEEKKVEAKADLPAGKAGIPSTDGEKTKTPIEAPKEDEGKEVEVPAKFKKLVEEVESMTVLELNELVKILEKKFGVSAQAVAVAPAGGDDAEGEEQDLFTVELTAFGDQKIAVIKVVKAILALGLKEAKDMVEAAPTTLKEGIKKEEAEEMKTKIEEAGGTVTLK